ncbi:Type IV pilus biogenesis and competence protein pilQ precursor [Ralstonia mannitolilytica]|uniref:Type IV pilus biogenesis and competence protein PilQ n=2 Tax=Ralstonia mannitolilytica TaxID=105219 RepID=A0AAJ4ZRN0_9RALS|nr:Type 3 secretion system secretin [Ralstonia mannitolilytica]CAJ0727897.1 Type 3 secretion system secretin [Ralstonia mannitolilytica]SUD89009.1 Type IV pilus biogenesis and competence protein pilQ precursor [Ralstonia mannitolilytica]SUD94969.1 Type IV pilus biogenesis and competence protein pilQ precursor [Ralstonia mannitolilytica]SUE42432.1 Type IV pilus biogenesis and competence protein pilQ precursor [Ralstonia mannitolilytica]
MTMRLVKGGLSQAARVARGGAVAWLALCWVFMAGQAAAQQAAPAAAAANAIEKVEQATAGESTVVTITLKSAPAQKPVEFSTQQPARIAIDFFGAGFAQGRANYQYGGKLLRSANVVQIGDRTRVVLDLVRQTQYKSEVRGNQYVLTLEAAPVASAAPAPTFSAPPPTAGAERPAVRNVDFRRGEDQAGRVVVDLSTANSAINIAQQGQNLVVDFVGATLPQSLRRRYDVSDFGTPVQAMRATDNGTGARLIIEPRGNWQYSSYQTDTQFVVEVRPTKEDPNKLIAGPGYRGERLSLNFQNIDVRSLLQVFADFTNLNIVTSDSVTGTLSLRLKDVPWDQALQIVLDSKGLASRRNGNVLWVAPRGELATKEKAELESQQQVTELEPLRSQVFRLNYQSAGDVRNMLLGAGAAGGAGGAAGGAATSRVLSKRGSLTADLRTNQLFVSDIPSKLEEVQAFIQKIDIPVRQVMIEARIVEADDTFSRNLGAKLGFMNRTNGSGVGNSYTNVLSPITENAKWDNSPAISFPANGINGVNAASLAVSLFNAGANRFLALELSALEADGRGKIISSPRVVTADNIKALIEQGTEIPYQQATSSGATSVSFKKANLKLEVTPKITPDGNVFLDVDVNKDSVGIQTTNGFAIDTKHVQTQVLVENGGTVVIGGIYTQNERTDVNKVPLLGDIPVVGNLFKSTNKINNRTELLVFLTPRVLSDQLSLK